jgi:sulfide:quinone oxidoreductase
MSQPTVILGAGFGGLTVATELRDALGADHEVVLLDRRDDFVLGLRKLWAVAGIGTLEEGRRSRATLTARGIPFLRRTIASLDPSSRRVVTDVETFDAGHLVVALGAETRPDLVPGFRDNAHNLYDVDAIPALTAALDSFEGGRIAIVIAGAPYKCPPAPYECAMLLHERLDRDGLRGATEIVVSTLQPMLLPNAGAEGSAWLGERLHDRKIEFHVQRKVSSVAPGRVVFADGASLAADLIVGIPPHRVPRVVSESGLTDGGDWIPVDPRTLRTAHEGVYAIGDVTQIRLGNGLPLPKAGLMAEMEGRRVARAIVAEVRGEAPPDDFDGRGHCFLETGADEAALIEGDFFATPEPRVVLRGADGEHAREKRAFETDRLERWFGG